MSRSVLYSSPDEARRAASSAITVEGPSSISIQVRSAELAPLPSNAEEDARESIQSALAEVIGEWDRSPSTEASAQSPEQDPQH